MSLKRKESHVDSRAKNGAIFFVVCEPNPATFVKISSAMQAKGYSDKESKDKTMQMRKLGSTLEVSALGLGCMGMTSNYGPPADKAHQ
jgi:hypothetical protein